MGERKSERSGRRGLPTLVRRDLVWLLLLSLAVRLGVAALTARPGYMDPAYYAAQATWMARGQGLTEPFIWNYLDDPAGVPHPGFAYWMPLPSFLAAPMAALLPGSFFALQLPFALLSALLPLVAYAVARGVAGRRSHAWLAGLLTLFSGFFFPNWTLPETFAPFALWGSLALWLGGRGMDERGNGLPVGLLVGLAHLTRADGVLLLPVVALAPLASLRRGDVRGGILGIGRGWLELAAGYLLVMGPWFLRNTRIFGAPLPPAGAKTLWLTQYDDLFCYGCELSPDAYLAWGWERIARSKLWALGVNLERLLAEDCLIFLLPFVLAGLYALRRRASFVLSAVYLALALLTHSVAFTFPGARGGFFHASAAALPFLYAAAAVGLERAVGWAARRRRWKRRQAVRVFSMAAVVGAVALSAHAAAAKVPASRHADEIYREIGAWMDERGAPDEAIVMVGNPPAFWLHAGRPAVVTPNGDVKVLARVVERYGVDYVLLRGNLPTPLWELYAGEVSVPWLREVAAWREGTVRLYEVRR